MAGCAGGPSWPAEPAFVNGSSAMPASVLWEPHGPDNGKYLQSCRGGVKRALFYDANGDGQFERMADLDELDPRQIRRVFILIDGVPYSLFKQLYDQGHFRLFHPPAKMIAPFPSLTDVSFASILGLPGTSCYEAAVFDPQANRMHAPTKVYLAGSSMSWAAGLDYIQPMWVDGVSYVLPRYAVRREFRSMFRRVGETLHRRPGQQNVLVYSVSTDAVCHVAGWRKAREMMIELDRHIERLMFDNAGQIGVVLVSGHGNDFAATSRKLDVDRALGRAGLTPVYDRGFKRAGEVVVPRYGLIGLVRAYCQNEADRGKLVDALLLAEGVEHVVWRRGDVAYVATRAGRVGLAEIRSRSEKTEGGVGEFFSYAPVRGDPLNLLGLLEVIETHRFDGDEAVYYSARDLLAATADHTWPDPLWRIWHGLDDHTAVVPDVVASLSPGWYFGTGWLDAFADLGGTHGGLRDEESNAFFTTTMFAPPAVMRAADVTPAINAHFSWTPPAGSTPAGRLEQVLQPQDGTPIRNLK